MDIYNTKTSVTNHTDHLSSRRTPCSCIQCHSVLTYNGMRSHYKHQHPSFNYTIISAAIINKHNYNKLSPTCQQCNKKLSYSKRNNSFCNRSCAAIYTNSRRGPRSEATIEKTRKSRQRYLQSMSHLVSRRAYRICTYPPKPKTCIHCGKRFIGKWGRVCCSRACANKITSQKISARLRDPEFRNKYYMSRIGNNQSYMERTFEEWLIQHGITNFNKEHHFFNPHLNKHYFVDFMFPELMLIIELDGDHHKLLIEQDAIRDAYLLSIGYNIIRINQREYRHQLKLQQVSDALGI